MNKIERKSGARTYRCKVSNGSSPIQKLTPPPSMPVIHESEELSTMEKEGTAEAKHGAEADAKMRD